MNKKLQLSEEDLVEMLRSKNRQGYYLLYDRYSIALTSIILRITGNQQTSEDVLQETFVKIWTCFHLYTPEKGRLFTWIACMARHLALDEVKSKSSRRNRSNLDLSCSGDQIDRQSKIVFLEEQVGVKALLKYLKPEHEQIFELIYFQGFTHVEAAFELSIPLGTIKTRIKTGLAKLKLQFAEKAA